MSDTDKITHVPVEPQGDDRRGGIPKWLTFTIVGVVALVVLFFGAIFLYAKVLNDSPDEFTEADLDAALSAEGGQNSNAAAPEATVATADPPVAATTPVSAPPEGTQPPAAVSASGWAATDQSQVGYRVEEVLFGVNTTAVGRTNEVDGSLRIERTAVTGVDFTVDVASITSDETRRDSAFRGRVMSADEFPTATFSLTQPIELGVEPADGVEVTAPVSGELTLRGVTNPVTFDVTAKQDNGLIGVQGSIPVVFSDYGIANPSNGGITTEDNGLVEFVLVFEPA